jgi:hypothetical protein
VIRLVHELMFTLRIPNRAKVQRMALAELGDRVLPANWRETVGWEDEDAA